MKHQFAWKGPHTMEAFQIKENGSQYLVSSYVNGVLSDRPFAIRYEVKISDQWSVQEFTVESLTNASRVHIRSDGKGRWSDHDGARLSDFDGCIDIDISVTPFTNTLPIKRLNDQLRKRQHLDVLYIKVPEFELKKVDQFYTCINPRLYRYEGVFRNFTADLPVDEHGFVTSYPGLFERVYPPAN